MVKGVTGGTAREGAPLPDSFDPLEVAIDAERFDPTPDSPARTLLTEQVRLIRADLSHRHIQIASERVGMALKLLTGAAGLAAAGALIAMAWSAHNDHGLVIEPFSVPQDLATQGLTGQVAASRLLDKLNAMQAKTDSQRAPDSFADNWGDDIKVEIPSTGVSIGELEKFLHQWLGHQTRIGGDIVHTPTGLAVTARVDAIPSKILDGDAADLDALTQKAAEAVFSATQPYRYGIYLIGAGDNAGAAAHFRETIRTSNSPAERAWAQVGLSNALSNLQDGAGALKAARASLDDNPGFLPGLGQVEEMEGVAGHDAAALAAGRRTLGLLKAGSTLITPRALKAQRETYGANVAEYEGDANGALAANRRGSRLPDYNDAAHVALYYAAFDQAELHDFSGAWASFAGIPRDRALDAIGQALTAMLISDLQDDPVRTLAASADLKPAMMGGDLFWAVGVAPYRALALARSGDIAAAQALIATTPADCYACVTNRARIEGLAGDHAAADRWFAHAVSLGPQLPRAHAAWAKALLARGDLGGAEAQARTASRLGPRFADPLETVGEAQLRRGDVKAAGVTLAKALALAPRWGRAHALLGETMMRRGRADAAKAEWTAALGMDLTPGERARVAYWMGRAHG